MALRLLMMVLGMLCIFCAANADVWLPASLTEIESQAFMNASWLSGSCVIPEGTRIIGAQAFAGCKGITTLTIPESVTSIGAGAFANCTGLTGSVTIPAGCSVASDAFSGCTGLTVIYQDADPSELFNWKITSGKVTITGYKGGRTVTRVSIPAMINGYPVTAIDAYVFSSSRYLTHISLPETISTIGNYAFAYSSRLTSISMPTSVTSVGKYAFYYCSSLTGTVQFIDATVPANAFTGCKKLNVLTFSTNEDGTLTLSRYYGSQSHVEVPYRVNGRVVTGIGREAFSYRTGLETVSLPSSITTIGQSAFYYCSSLERISLPQGVTSVGASAFNNCTSLRQADLPDSITKIGSMAFYNCAYLSGSYMFLNASVDASAFNSCSNVEVWCCTLMESGAVRLDSCYTRASEIVVPGMMWDYEVTGMKAQAFYSCPNVTSVTLPDTFTAIADEAFLKCTTLKRVSIPATVRTIGEKAFSGCTALQSVTLPAGVTNVGYQAFYNCTAMTTLTLGGGNTVISSHAFANCSSLSNVTLAGSERYVGNLAFNGTPWLNNQLTAIALKETSACTTQYDKALVLHDWLIENTAYDLSYTHYGSEGVLFHGVGVCNAYTLTYSRLLSAVGISNMTVTGTATDRNSGVSGGHAWTLVKLDGSWYHVDTTWDDPVPDGRERHTYFCLTDAEMAVDHTWDQSDYPAANGNLYSYFFAIDRTEEEAPAEAAETAEETITTTTRNKRR